LEALERRTMMARVGEATEPVNSAPPIHIEDGFQAVLITPDCLDPRDRMRPFGPAMVAPLDPAMVAVPDVTPQDVIYVDHNHLHTRHPEMVTVPDVTRLDVIYVDHNHLHTLAPAMIASPRPLPVSVPDGGTVLLGGSERSSASRNDFGNKPGASAGQSTLDGQCTSAPGQLNVPSLTKER
jgi:hypothetical protein